MKSLLLALILATTCCACGVLFAFPERLMLEKRRTHETYFCPNGHTLYFPHESDVEKRDREIKMLNARLTNAREDAEWQKKQRQKEERRVRAYRGVVGKMRRRVGNGVCPCCNRTFKQLSAHMENKHPHFKATQ